MMLAASRGAGRAAGDNAAGASAGSANVRVTDSFGVERYSHVMHIVSNVEGALADGLDVVDALMAGFPAGTVSGAPKVRAMEVINELEKHRRGIYGGGVGYFGAGGDMDTASRSAPASSRTASFMCRPAAASCSTATPSSNWKRPSTRRARFSVRRRRLGVTLDADGLRLKKPRPHAN